MGRKLKKGDLPELNDIEQEMTQVRSKGKFRQALKGTIGTVIVVAAVAVLVAFIFLPVLRITGTSMQPTFQPGDIVLIYKTDNYKEGEVCSFYYNNKLILKRIIGMEGDRIEMDEQGHVTVNGVILDEIDYISEYALGMCDIDFPFVVPAGTVFVMGDNRDNSVDSRATNFGCIKKDELVGKVLARVYPFNGLAWYGF